MLEASVLLLAHVNKNIGCAGEKRGGGGTERTRVMTTTTTVVVVVLVLLIMIPAQRWSNDVCRRILETTGVCLFADPIANLHQA